MMKKADDAAWRGAMVGRVMDQTAALALNPMAGHFAATRRRPKACAAHPRHTSSEVAESLNFTRRAAILRMDEMGQTGTAFNSLLERLTNLRIAQARRQR